MAIGMSYEQYWYGDVRMVGAFLKADELRQKRQDQEMWKMGMYIYDAIGRLAPIFKFGVKNPKPVPYIEHPYSYKENTDLSEAEKEQRAENERIKAIWYFRRWADDTSKRFK